MAALRSLASASAERVRTLPDRHGRGPLVAVCLIVAIGFGLRAERALLRPLENPGPDATAYTTLARELYEDGDYGTPQMRNETDWSPGAVFFYAGAFILSGGYHPEGFARLVVAVLGALSIVVAYLLGRRLGGPPAGLLAAGLVAVYPAFVYNSGRLMSEPPAVFTLPAAVLAFLWAAEQRSRWAWLLPGFLLGITAFIRPEYLVFGSVFALLALWRMRRGPATWQPALILLAAFALVVTPWIVRNWIVLDRFVPLSTGGGKALYVGTNLPADGDYFRVKAALVERYYHRRVDRAELARIAMRPLLDREARRHPDEARDVALGRIGRENFSTYFGDRPFAYIGMLGRKAWRMWRTGFTKPMVTGWGKGLHRSLLVLGAIGLALLAWRRRWEAVVIGALILGITAVGAFLLASTRRNLTLMPLVMVLAGTALAWFYALVREWAVAD
jgi:4-amino-4-deoxy-L-arabinose transferase-like glycosyltransferase